MPRARLRRLASPRSYTFMHDVAPSAVSIADAIEAIS